MTLEEKIGQLLIIPACQLRGDDHFEDLQFLIKERKVGGVLLKQGTAAGQRNLIEKLQKMSSIPLFCVQDGEWGVAMRLNDALSFPRNLTLGAIQDLSLFYQLGREIGRQCRLVGAHINLAPVIDVNCNPQNPIIHTRSFGEDPIQVSVRCSEVMRGIQSMGVIACAKHFPGHGDTSVDSHVDLPIIAHDIERLRKIELYPFQKLIEGGVGAVMTAHLYVQALDTTPATFSSLIVSRLLQEQMGFAGLVISDALNMSALVKYETADRIAINALLAGHDFLLYGDHIAPNIDQILRIDVPLVLAALKTAVEKGEIPEKLIDSKVAKILRAKEKSGLFEKVSTEQTEEINSADAIALKKKLFEEAITLVRNEGVLPLKNQKIALVEWSQSQVFKSILEKNCVLDVFSLTDADLLIKVQDYSCIVLSLFRYTSNPPDFGLGPKEQSLLDALAQCKVPVVAVVFGTPYSLLTLPLFEAVLVAFERDPEAQEAAAKTLLGQLNPKGRLPVTIFPQYPLGTGISFY